MPYTTCNGVLQLEALIGDQGDVALIISFDSDKMTGHIESYTPIPMAFPDSVSFNPLSYVSSPSDSSDSDSPLLSSFTTSIADSTPTTDAATYSSILTRIYLSACDSESRRLPPHLRLAQKEIQTCRTQDTSCPRRTP